MPFKMAILQILQYLYKIIYFNCIQILLLFIVLKIILTLTISVASAERSFSRLKIIKNYLRSNISQERFTPLATLSIECDSANKLNYHDVIIEFVIKHVKWNPCINAINYYFALRNLFEGPANHRCNRPRFCSGRPWFHQWATVTIHAILNFWVGLRFAEKKSCHKSP